MIILIFLGVAVTGILLTCLVVDRWCKHKIWKRVEYILDAELEEKKKGGFE